MCYKVTTHDWRGHEIPEKNKHYSLCNWYDELNIVCGFEQVKTIPAWSLHRLAFLLDASPYPIYLDSNAYNDIIDDIEELINHNEFNKEYLV